MRRSRSYAVDLSDIELKIKEEENPQRTRSGAVDMTDIEEDINLKSEGDWWSSVVVKPAPKVTKPPMHPRVEALKKEARQFDKMIQSASSGNKAGR